MLLRLLGLTETDITETDIPEIDTTETGTTDTSIVKLQENVITLEHLDIDAPKDDAVPEHEHQVPLPEADTTAMALAEALASSLPSPQGDFENDFFAKVSLGQASGDPGPQDLPGVGGPSTVPIRKAQIVSSSSSPSLEEWNSEPEALFNQVYVSARDFDKLNEQRLGLVTTLVKARELRKTLQVQRATVLERQSKLLQDLRVLILMGGKRDLDQLMLQLDEIETLNDSLRSAEDYFDQFEADLIEQEWDLKSAELRLYTRDTEVPPDLVNPQTWQKPTYNYSRVETVDLGGRRRSGDLEEQAKANLPGELGTDLLRIQIHELELQHQDLLQEAALREDVGLSLDDDSKFALRTFSVRHAELVQHLEHYQERAEQKQHILGGPFILDTSFDQFPAYQYTGDDLEVLSRQYTPNGVHESVTPRSDELNLSLQDLPRDRNPMLLPTALLGEAEPPLAPFTSCAIFAITDDHRLCLGSHYINDWLLYMLRSSALEITYLRFHLEDNGVKGSLQSIKQSILSFWYKDGSDTWYVNSTKWAAESLDPTIISQSNDIELHPTLSDSNLAKRPVFHSSKYHSRSMFARRDEVKDTNSILKDHITSD
jgi:hypothetical protein